MLQLKTQHFFLQFFLKTARLLSIWSSWRFFGQRSCWFFRTIETQQLGNRILESMRRWTFGADNGNWNLIQDLWIWKASQSQLSNLSTFNGWKTFSYIFQVFLAEFQLVKGFVLESCSLSILQRTFFRCWPCESTNFSTSCLIAIFLKAGIHPIGVHKRLPSPFPAWRPVTNHHPISLKARHVTQLTGGRVMEQVSLSTPGESHTWSPEKKLHACKVDAM